VLAIEAMPRPMACRTRENTPLDMTVMVYVLGAKRDSFELYKTTILERQRWIAALEKTGPIMRGTT